MDAESLTLSKVRRYWRVIKLKARRFGLDPYILAGIVARESGGDPWAVRAEPTYKWLWGEKKQDFYMQCISYGLCQVMGATAREFGFKGYLTQLCEPHLGLQYGASYLTWCLHKTDGDIDKALLKYNGGGDKEYPTKVKAWAEKIKREVK